MHVPARFPNAPSACMQPSHLGQRACRVVGASNHAAPTNGGARHDDGGGWGLLINVGQAAIQHHLAAVQRGLQQFTGQDRCQLRRVWGKGRGVCEQWTGRWGWVVVGARSHRMRAPLPRPTSAALARALISFSPLFSLAASSLHSRSMMLHLRCGRPGRGVGWWAGGGGGAVAERWWAGGVREVSRTPKPGHPNQLSASPAVHIALRLEWVQAGC